MISMARRTSMHPDAFNSRINARRSLALSDLVVVARQRRVLDAILHGTTTGDVLGVSPRNVGVEIYQP